MPTIPTNRQRIENAAKAIEFMVDQLPIIKARMFQQTLIIQIASHNTIRRKGRYRTRRKSVKMTPAVRAHIIATAAAHPDWSQQEIAVHCGVNAGRVSEVLHGKRR